MVILNEVEVVCEECGEKHTIHEYVGLEGAWYTSHICDINKVLDNPPTMR